MRAWGRTGSREAPEEIKAPDIEMGVKRPGMLRILSRSRSDGSGAASPVSCKLHWGIEESGIK
jgi:hypothetical protein